MRSLLILALMLAASAASAAPDLPRPPNAGPPPPPLPMPPPLPTVRSEAVPRIVQYGPPPGVAHCGGRNVGVARNAPFAPEVSVAYLPVGSAPDTPGRGDRNLSAVTFGIDAKGAPIDVRRADDAPASEDMLAALARWRFMAGAPASDCRVEVSQTYTPLTKAPTALLLEVVALRKREALTPVRSAISARGDCGRSPRRIPAITSYPDLRSFTGRDFSAPWAGVLYDIDAEGEVQNVRIATQGGDPVLADLAAASIADSRFHSGKAVKGCYAVFSVRPETVEATAKAYPKTPSPSKERDCSDVKAAALNLSIQRSYPSAFARQAVEGWALIEFDIRADGRITPVNIVAAQPSAAFGTAARNMLASARPDTSVWDRKGCLIPVTFAMNAVTED